MEDRTTQSEMEIKMEGLQVLVVVSHAAGRIDKLGLSHLAATCPGLSTAAGQFGLLWPTEGGNEPPGEEMGVRGSCVEFLMPHNQRSVQRRGGR